MDAPLARRTDRTTQRTIPPADGRTVVLFDGDCAFCARSSSELARLSGGPARVRRISFREHHALQEFPGVDFDACVEAMHVVLPSGDVVRGAEAIVGVLSLRPALRWLPVVYRAGFVRSLLEAIYRFVARRRFAVFMRRHECEGGSCAIYDYGADKSG